MNGCFYPMLYVRVTVTGVMADRHPADLHLFTNYQLPADILGAREDLPPELSPIKGPVYN